MGKRQTEKEKKKRVSPKKNKRKMMDAFVILDLETNSNPLAKTYRNLGASFSPLRKRKQTLKYRIFRLSDCLSDLLGGGLNRENDWQWSKFFVMPPFCFFTTVN